MNQWLNRCYIGDVRAVLGQMAADGVTVQMCVTSPPYWGLRDYGTAQWKGGSEACDHREDDRRNKRPLGKFHGGDDTSQTHPYRDTCGKCGARRIDQQIGLESTPEEFGATMVEVFRGVWDVLADDGTVWLNLGDAYASGAVNHSAKERSDLPPGELVSWANRDVTTRPRTAVSGLKPKDLVGIPWRVAFALQADGWYLRSDIIWHKPNPMPESVVDRPTKSHEYLFLLSKNQRYYYDAEAVKEPQTGDLRGRTAKEFPKSVEMGQGIKSNASFHRAVRSHIEIPGGRNRRSVWTIPTEPFSEAHFATFPRKLVEPCVMAGSRPGDTVLDPFLGSGTVGQVSQHLGRHWIGIDLNPHYTAMQTKRTAQHGLVLA